MSFETNLDERSSCLFYHTTQYRINQSKFNHTFECIQYHAISFDTYCYFLVCNEESSNLFSRVYFSSLDEWDHPTHVFHYSIP